MRSGGPLAWKANRQECTSLSSCKAEIRATNMGAHLTVNTRNMISSLSDLGYPIDNTTLPTSLYKDNDACVKWCHNMTTKGDCHIKNRENSTPEWVTGGTISVTHIAGKCNVSDIFTKEMQDGANFRQLRDLFMCRASNYLKGIHYLASNINIGPSPDPTTPSPTLAQSTQIAPPDRPGIMDILLSYPCSHTSSTLSCISAAGCQILSRLAPPSYLQALMSDPMGGVLTRVASRFGISVWYRSVFSRYFTNRYRRKTRSGRFGIVHLAGTPFFPQREHSAPFLMNQAPL
jgi:hypothetical protein